MCFSATASLSAGVLLLGIGTLTLKSVSRKSDLLFAAIPLLFAIQQLSEGVIWLTFRYEAPLLNMVMTYVFTFFSHVLWPVYLPVAVMLMEPSGWRRNVLCVFSAAGAAVSMYLLYYQIAFPIVSLPIGHHVKYIAPHFYREAVMSTYLMSTTVSMLLSSHQMVIVFGILSLLAFAVAYFFYTVWFISVWCFFCALLSIVIYLHIKYYRRSHFLWR